jgi:hypothetical protein
MWLIVKIETHTYHLSRGQEERAATKVHSIAKKSYSSNIIVLKAVMSYD